MATRKTNPKLRLLQKGWAVIAVDSSQTALQCLAQQANLSDSNWITDGQLILVHQDMKNYEFPKDVKIILANNSLPYCDPLGFQTIWKKAHASLATGGRMIGNFFPVPNDPVVERLQRGLMGVWFTDPAVVTAFLDHVGYQTEICGYNKYWFESDPKCIQFIGQKKSDL
ncbi:MAG: hypothetical protein ACRDF4_01685 [Rhabdochlamydiaceae bacterium]